MGIIISIGSLARIFGPLMVTFIYNDYGLYLTFGILETMLLASLIFPILFYKRIIPMKMPKVDDSSKEQIQ